MDFSRSLIRLEDSASMAGFVELKMIPYLETIGYLKKIQFVRFLIKLHIVFCFLILNIFTFTYIFMYTGAGTIPCLAESSDHAARTDNRIYIHIYRLIFIYLSILIRI